MLQPKEQAVFDQLESDLAKDDKYWVTKLNHIRKAFETLRHVHYDSQTMHEIELYGDGELAHCKVCNGAEGSLPTMCPRRKMSEAEEKAVYAGTLDFANHQWVRPADVKHRPECKELSPRTAGTKWCKCFPIPFNY